MTLGPEVQTLTRAMTAILCKGLDGCTPQEILDLPSDSSPASSAPSWSGFAARRFTTCSRGSKASARFTSTGNAWPRAGRQICQLSDLHLSHQSTNVRKSPAGRIACRARTAMDCHLIASVETSRVDRRDYNWRSERWHMLAWLRRPRIGIRIRQIPRELRVN